MCRGEAGKRTTGAARTKPSFQYPEFAALPPRVRQAVESIAFALTLKAGDMDGISAVNLARDGGIVIVELHRQMRRAPQAAGRGAQPGAQP